MIDVSVLGVGLHAPGLPSWHAALPVLRGERAWEASPLPAVTLPLPPAERRRTSACTRAAWAAADQALTGAAFGSAAIRTVFASSAGDGNILHQLCAALALPDRAISPTQFHNSVHNAPAGYHSIARASHAPSTSLAHHSAPFAAGLLEAAVQVAAEQAPVLLTAYDLAAPFPLAPTWPAQADFAVALLVGPPAQAGALAQWRIAVSDGMPEDTAPQWVTQLIDANPVAASLRVLGPLACGAPETRIRLPFMDNATLEVTCKP